MNWLIIGGLTLLLSLVVVVRRQLKQEIESVKKEKFTTKMKELEDEDKTVDTFEGDRDEAIKWTVALVNDDFADSVRDRYGDIPEAHATTARKKAKKHLEKIGIEASDEEIDQAVSAIK